MPRIMPKDKRRECSRFHQPAAFLRAGARQIRSSAFCSSPNTVIAPRSSIAVPVTVAITPPSGLSAACSSRSTAAAPSSPISPRSWPKISPRAASSPNTRPATPMTISSSGAIEKSV
jgi:hypothetical protein